MQKFLSVYGFRGIFEVIKMMMNIRISSVFNFNGFILYSILTNTVGKFHKQIEHKVKNVGKITHVVTSQKTDFR
jgi:hypothetical protein